jgi:hypothetical protein
LESRFDLCFYFVIKYIFTARPRIFRDLYFLYFILEFLTILFCENRTEWGMLWWRITIEIAHLLRDMLDAEGKHWVYLVQ